MKVISLHQPWASLVMLGAKRFETRSWSTKHRGELAIHASKTTVPYRTNPFVQHHPFTTVLGDHIPTFGAIIAVVNLLDVVPIISAHRNDDSVYLELSCSPPRLLTGNLRVVHGEFEWAFGDYTPGRFAWIFSPEVTVLPTPIPLRGHQGIFNYDLNP